MADTDGLIRLPHNGWAPRPYQRKLWNYLEKGGKRAVAIWHRRAGKDEVCLHWTATAAHTRVGCYWHMLPEASQARKAVWDAVNPHTGQRRINEAFPRELRESTRETDMAIRFKSGSLWQLVGSDNFNCFSDDTEILTRDGGWLLFSELTGDELVATLDEGDELVYAPIREVMSYDYEGEMYRVYNNAIDLLTTPNHQFYVESGKGFRKFKRIDDPTILGDKIPATCWWQGVEPRKFVLPVVDYDRNTRLDIDRNLEFAVDDWCAFLGIYLSEGSTFSDGHGNYRVTISQTKPAICEDINELLTRMELHYRYDANPGNFVISNKQLFEYCRQFGLQHERYVPVECKGYSRGLLSILRDWLVKGDGNLNGNNTLSYATTSRRLAGDFQELLIKTGYSGNMSVRHNSGGMIRGRPINSTRPLYCVYRRLSKFKHFRDTEESYVSQEEYSGKVWCVDAGSHVIKVRRNGKEAWCGNSLVGSPPIGVVFSEFALADPSAWGYLRPILAENGGWALFITTPRGRNHAATFYEAAHQDPTWFSEQLPATDTSVFTWDQLEIEHRELLREYGPDDGEARYRQEYLVSFDAGVMGSYYGSLMEAAEKEKRIGKVLHEPTLPVHTSWDLGIGDATAIWCWQLVGQEIRAIDYIENSGVGLDYYARELDRRPWKWGEHILPHDSEARELGTGRSRIEVLRSLGFHRTQVIPAQKVEDGINAVRTMLPRIWFDAEKCARGISALQNYRRSWNDALRTYSDRPLHDWTSHAADSLRYWALSNTRNAGSARPIKYPDLAVV
jgi:hypothetical protein